MFLVAAGGAALAQTNSNARSGRFIRGSDPEPSFQTFVIALSGQKGVGVGETGGGGLAFLEGRSPWYLDAPDYPGEIRLHIGRGNGEEFVSSPLVGFGSQSGGSPLYLGQRYRFGVYFGARREAESGDHEIEIHAFASGIPTVRADTLKIRIPRKGTPEWDAFAAAGYRLAVPDSWWEINKATGHYGLKTWVQLVEAVGGVGMWGVGDNHLSPVILTHEASNPAYFFRVMGKGHTFDELGGAYPMVASLNGSGDLVRFDTLYTMDFEARPPWESTFIHAPHFEGEPMPPEYAEKSLEEFLSGRIEAQLAAPTPGMLATDNSPELRDHPALERLLAGLGGDPIAAANYVANEIGLADGLSYSESGDVGETSVNCGGLRRGALGVYLEGRGSPAEQCALLVWLLRKSGVPAAYVRAQNLGLVLPDRLMGRLLRMRVAGYASANGTMAVPAEVAVNYPWVAAWVPDPANPGQNKWVHLFPWLKDTEIIEGADVWDFLPEGLATGREWAKKFLQRDPAIFAQGSGDTPSGRFPAWLDTQLAAAGVSRSEVGMSFRDRRHRLESWEHFPQGKLVEGAQISPIEKFADVPGVIDSVQILLWKDTTPNQILDAGEAIMANATIALPELGGRRLLVYPEALEGGGHSVSLVLSPLRAGALPEGDFSAPLGAGRQVQTTVLETGDDWFGLSANMTFLGAYPPGFESPDPRATFLEITAQKNAVAASTLRRGDTAAIVFNFGCHTRAMTDPHIADLDAAARALEADPQAVGDGEVFRGVPLWLLGANYFARTSAFREEIDAIFKTTGFSSADVAVCRFEPVRDAGGTLPAGEIVIRNPAIDVVAHMVARAFNGSVRTDLGELAASASFDLWAIDASAQEHAALDATYGLEGSISTVKLLHNAQSESRPPVIVNKWNLEAAGNTTYTSGNTTLALKDWDTSIWSSVTEFFANTTNGTIVPESYAEAVVTPGDVSGAAGNYTGMGAFLLSGANKGASALIQRQLRGGYGPDFAPCAFDPENYGGMRVAYGRDGLPHVLFACMVAGWNGPQFYWWDAATFQQGTYSAALDSYDVELMTGAASLYGLPYLPGDNQSLRDNKVALADKGDTGKQSFFGDVWAMALDPVHVVTGEFHIDETDLALPGPMPIEIRRNYSSQNLAESELGYGWKAAQFPYLRLAGDLIYASEPDGSVVAYRLDAGVWKPKPSDNPTLSNVTGLMASRIESVSGNYTQYLRDGSTRVFTTQSFPGGGINRTRPYLQRWNDPNGNFLAFQMQADPALPGYGRLARITSSNGNFVGFDHDPLGRVTAAYTADGRRVSYRYDDAGDLVEVIRPDKSAVSYEYAPDASGPSHLIIRERKPDGRILENDYDALRRVTEQRATVGDGPAPVRNGTFLYSNVRETDPQSPHYGTLTGSTTILDAYDRQTIYGYAGGQVTSITDPLTHAITQTWYAPGDTSPGAFPRSLASRTDKRGLTRDYSYDTAGNPDSEITTGDLTGDGAPESATTDYTYNTLGLPTQILDPLGNRVEIFYEDAVHPRLPTRIEKYTAASALVSRTVNEYTDVIQGGREAHGLLWRVTRAQGTADAAVTEWSFDARGFPLTMTRFTGTSDPVVTSYVFNERGEMIEQSGAGGRKIQYAHDDMGRRIWEEYFQGTARVGWNARYFNGNGEVEWEDGPRYNPEDYIWHKYDRAGRPSELLVWRSKPNDAANGVDAGLPDKGLYSGNTYKHDLFGNLVTEVDPIAATTHEYDDIGGLLASHRHNGGPETAVLSSESYTREPGGLPATHTNPLGGVTTYSYTSDGKPARQENPDGTVLEWRYQLDGRIERQPVNHNTYYEVAYDDAARTVTKTLKTIAGTTLATESKTFDMRGNCVSETDRAGATWTHTFDGLDRPKTSTGPPAGTGYAQQSLAYSYDASGETVTTTNALGEKILASTDIMGRTTRVEIRDSSGTLVDLTTYTYSPDHNSVTITRGSGAAAVTRTVFTDTTGAEVLSIDGAGGKTLTLRNQLGLPGLLIDPAGRETSLTYDTLHRLHIRTRPDGASETLTYNAAGNLSGRNMNGALFWGAAYDSAGRMTSQWKSLTGNGSQTGVFEYAYYDSGPKTGLLATTTDPRGITITHDYDAFRRPASFFSGGGPAISIQTITWAYDARGLLTSAAQSGGDQYASQIIRTHSPYGRILSETVNLNGEPHSSATQTWDASGRRASLESENFSETFTHNAAGRLVGISSGGQSYSFGFTNGGLPDGRTNPFRSVSVTARDGAGRPTAITTSAGSGAILAESLSYLPDGRLEAYSATPTGGSWADTRAYGYDANARLASESFAPQSGATSVFSYTIDPNKLGIRESGRIIAGPLAGWGSLVLEYGPAREIVLLESNTARQTVPASGIALGAQSVNLAVNGSSVGEAVHPGWADGVGAWSANLTLSPGNHTLSAVAVHPSGYESAPATSTFSVTGTPEQRRNYFNIGGYIEGMDGPEGIYDAFFWDAAGRMAGVIRYDPGGSSFQWVGLNHHDALGRRLRARFYENGVWKSVRSVYDPEHEFLEIGIKVGESIIDQYWKVFGPDVTGTLGGWNGVGGIEALVAPDGSVRGAINDRFGDVVAGISANGTVEWNPARTLSGGLQPDSTPQYAELGGDVLFAHAWRTRRADPTGYVWMGARFLDPRTNSFISPDPLGHAASWSLYDFADGDPVNGFDPDGRVVKQSSIFAKSYFAEKIISDLKLVAGVLSPIRWAVQTPYAGEIYLSENDSQASLKHLASIGPDDFNPARAVFNDDLSVNPYGLGATMSSVALGGVLESPGLFSRYSPASSPAFLPAAARGEGLAYRAINPQFAESTAQNGFFRSGAPGRLGNDGIYANTTPQGAIAEFQFHNPGVTPAVFEVNYPLSPALRIDPPSGYFSQPLPFTGGANILQAPSLRAPGTQNFLIREGATPGLRLQ